VHVADPGTSRSCIGTFGAASTAQADNPSSRIDSSSAARFGSGMTKAPAVNLWPPASNSRSAADIFTPAFWNLNVTSVLSVVWSTMRTRPLPVIVPRS
jgi:hypothetical protein